ncbi:thiamine pyrophosphate-dependent dehydrogenase E1 component subunit alpha [Streptomyces sporangiiformans]|uniref:Thiamine pyrophosphate-dependent dehydrogenase E1 component subunit alpha n=1 Tax=Streptomyces sporangiiformans TaxID=2315329 RepID=A0A505D976_9ACTN|nr:thiamine pyrophosphate-dependent dehydrogenase E1 component subunit alpha [Streptomyces sporangiiformans]
MDTHFCADLRSGGLVAESTAPTDDEDLAARTLNTLWRIRRFEEAVDELFARGLMHGTMHLSVGQEATATGACLALRPDDLISSTHRGHGHCIAKGADLNRMMAELLAKETGYCAGRGGSMHIADVTTGNLGANGIVAGGIPIAVGAALAQRLRGTDRVAVSFFGDGAANEGACHEAMNMAAIWSLPVVFFCENNRYGMSFSTERAFAVKEISERAAGYGMPGVTIDGNDVDAVYAATRDAVARARSGEGPTFIEAVTYRWKGHSKSDQNLYRTRDEIEEWRARDPISRFERAATASGALTERDVEEIRGHARDAVRAAVETGLAAPDARPGSLLDAVYATPAGRAS